MSAKRLLLPVVATLPLLFADLAAATTSLVQSFEGGDASVTAFRPGDSSLGVGPNHVVQAVNGAGYRVYDRNGNLVQGYTPLPLCVTTIQGSGGATPKVMYDAAADRWVFAWSVYTQNIGGSQEGSNLCVAVSPGSSPTTLLPAIPIGVQSAIAGAVLNGAAIGANSYFFGVSNDSGHHVVAVNRTKLLQAQPVGEFFAQPVSQAGTDVTSVPVDSFGPQTLPGPGGLFVGVINGPTLMSPDRIQMLRLTPAWETGSGSLLQALPLIPMTPFSVSSCYTGSLTCVPQPGTSTRLFAPEGVMTPRAGYRLLDDGSERLVMSFAHDMGGGRLGIRGYRFLRQLDGSYAMDLEGDFGANDSTYRFGSNIAINRLGTLGVGFLASSSMLLPTPMFGIYEPTDPGAPALQQEIPLLPGGGYSTTGLIGNFTDVVVDPVDGCSFWVSGEYHDVNGSPFRTRIGRYTQPACTNQVFADGFE